MPIVPIPKHFYRLKAAVLILIETDDVSAAAEIGFDLLDKIRTSGEVNGVAHSRAEIVSFILEAETKGGA